MINVLRKNQKALWIVIALLCIPFVFYFSNSDIGALNAPEFGTFYKRKISHVEAQRSARLFNLARDLGMFTYLQDMVAGATSENQAYVDFTWNRLILKHEGERLGIVPTREEILGVIKGLMRFRGAQGFDPNKYDQFVQMLPSMGFGDAQIEELAAEQLILSKLKEVVGSGVNISEAETRENYERAYGKLHLTVVRVRSEDLAKEVQVSDEDVAQYYEAHKAELNTEEKRRVAFVMFGLDEEQKKLAGKERVEVLQKLADRANDFNQALLEKGAQFDQVAAKFQLPIQTTGAFTKSQPDPLFGPNPQLAETAFQLTLEDPNSDAVQVADSFYVLHLGAIEASRPLALEEAKPKVVEAIKNQRVRELVMAKGAEAAKKIKDAIAGGTPVEAAALQSGLPPEKIPPFALADPPAMKMEEGKPPQPQPEAPDMQMIKGAVAEMNPGEVSEFIPTEAGGVVAVLEKREQPDPAKYDQAKTSFAARFVSSKREIAFYEWLRERRRAAGVPASTPDIPGGPEVG